MQEKTKFIQIRVSETEKEKFKKLSADYGLDMSRFILAVMQHIDVTRPVLTIVPKDVAQDV